MATPFLSEIKLFAFNFPPRGFAFCNGQLMPINQNQALFALLGTTFGGNGQTTFALPNLQGRSPMHFGAGAGLTPRNLGESAGSETVTLVTSQIPSHTHQVQCNSGDATLLPPANDVWAKEPNGNTPFAATATPGATLAPAAIGSTGGNQPHNNMGPSSTLNFCIALQGIFPSRN